jgi:hypothetical protein
MSTALKTTVIFLVAWFIVMITFAILSMTIKKRNSDEQERIRLRYNSLASTMFMMFFVFCMLAFIMFIG